MVSGMLAYKFGAPFAWITSLSLAAYIAFTLTLTQRTKFRKAMNKADNDARTRAINSLVDYEAVRDSLVIHATRRSFSDLSKYGNEDAALETQRIGAKFGQNVLFSTALSTVMVLCSHGIMNGQMTIGDLEEAEISDKKDAKPLKLSGGSILTFTLGMSDRISRLYPRFKAKEMVELRSGLWGWHAGIVFPTSHYFQVRCNWQRNQNYLSDSELHCCCIYSSGEHRRSPRIVELDARKAQARSQNKGNVICEVMDGAELDKGQDILKQKCGRKKVKTDNGIGEDHLVNSAIVPYGAAIPEKSKLELLLGILQRRDTHKIFAEPVNPEEVEYYYDVIKEPMDFGTIAKKLNEGNYQTLEEFEHDVFLVSNNAMLFNASNTVYYRQARALKELATRLFHALKTDPENFETEASIRRTGAGRRTKAEVEILNCNSNNKNNIGIAARGYGAQKRYDNFEVEKRRAYRPWNSFLSEKGSLVSAVCNSPKQLKLNEKVGVGYLESLKQFAKDLGPTAQMAAMKKVESYISEAMKVWNVTTNRQLWLLDMQIPNAAFAPNIKVPPSFKVPSSAPGCQNISGDKVDVHSGFSKGGQASMNDTVNINNALNRGISQPGSRVESLGDFQGRTIQSAGRGTLSLHLLGSSNGYQTFAGGTMDSPSSFWNGKFSAVNNIDMNDALTGGKGKPGNRMDFPEKVLQPMREGLDGEASFKDYAASQSNGVHLDSSFPNYDSGKGKLDFTALWYTESNQKELGRTSMMVDAMNVDNTVLTGQASLWSWMQESTPILNGSASSSSWHPTSQVMTGLNSSGAIGYMGGIGSCPSNGVYQKAAVNYGEGSRYGTNVEQGGVVTDLFKPLETGTQPLTENCFLEQIISPEMASLLQQKSKLDSLCEAPLLEDWLVSIPQEHVFRASSNAYERCQPQSIGESSSRAAADRRQKQPMLGTELPQ